MSNFQTSAKINTENSVEVQAVSSVSHRNTLDYCSLGSQLAQQQKWTEAIECFRQAIEVESDRWQNYHKLGDVLQIKKLWREAESAYRNAIALYDQSFWTYHNLGKVLVEQQQYEEAAKAFSSALEINPQQASVHYQLGLVWLQQQQYPKAISAFETAIQLEPNHWEAHHHLGDALLCFCQRQKAISAYRKVLELNPNYFWSYHNLGVALFRQGEAKAVNYLQKAIEIDSNNPSAHYYLGEVLGAAGQWKKAEAAYRTAIRLQPDWGMAHQSLAYALHQQALLDLKRARQLNLSRVQQQQINNLAANIIASAQNIKLVIPRSDRPLVSVIIPVYGKLDYTLRCLQSVARNTAITTEIEVIVVNDCSPDNTQATLANINGLILVNNQQNVGFVHSCNRGAAKAKGKYIYFLNNDTEIRPNCIESLIEVLERDEQVGIVGSKLIYPDGALQEAGGIIWSDGNGWNYGRMTNPDEPRYNYLRPVDYCSGASLMLRRETFEALGGFERDFAPAYYEDTDLCFAIRNRLGLKVVYQPLSELVHYEGITSGTSTESGVKRYQVVNHEKFQQKWQQALSQHPENQGAEAVAAASRRLGGSQTILVIDAYPPCYDRESGARRLFHLLQIFKQLDYHVIFAPDNAYREEPYVEELQQLGIEVLYCCDGYKVPITEQIQTLLPLIDYAWICRPELAEKYLALVGQNPKIKIIYDTIDLHYLRLRREWELLPEPRDIHKAKAWVWMQARELQLAHEVDLTVTVTPTEQEILQQQGVANVAVVPNIHQPYRVENRKTFQQRQGILFIGGYRHPPNVDAVLWLCQAIMPLVWQQIPDVHLTLLGNAPPEAVQNLAQDSRVRVPGFVQDVSPFFETHRVFVSPLRYGAGMKGKIGQSLEHGLPIVSTPIGTEGMGLIPGEHALEAVTTEAFAQQIMVLYQNQALWEKLSANSKRAIASFAPEAVKTQIAQILQQLNSPA